MYNRLLFQLHHTRAYTTSQSHNTMQVNISDCQLDLILLKHLKHGDPKCVAVMLIPIRCRHLFKLVKYLDYSQFSLFLHIRFKLKRCFFFHSYPFQPEIHSIKRTKTTIDSHSCCTEICYMVLSLRLMLQLLPNIRHFYFWNRSIVFLR